MILDDEVVACVRVWPPFPSIAFERTRWAGGSGLRATEWLLPLGDRLVSRSVWGERGIGWDPSIARRVVTKRCQTAGDRPASRSRQV